MSRAQRWLPRMFALMGALLLTALIWHFGWVELLAILRQSHPGWLLLMTALIVGGYVIRACKWRYVLGPGQDAAMLFFLAKAAGNWTPGRVGEFAPLLFEEHRTSRVTAWILADRVLEVWLTLAMGLLGGLATATAERGWIVAFGSLLLIGTLVGIAVIFFWQPSAPVDSGSIQRRAYKLLHILHQELQTLGSKIPLTVSITVLAKAMDMWAVMALFLAFGYRVDFLLVGAARLAHALVSASPLTPDSSGAPYVAAAVLLHQQIGIPFATLTAALTLEAVIIFGVAYLGYLVMGRAWHTHQEKKEEVS